MFIQENKAVSVIKTFFPEEILMDYLNVINTNIDIGFYNILPKTRRKNGHHKAILRLRGCLLISENIIETFVFILGNAARLLLKLYFKHKIKFTIKY